MDKKKEIKKIDYEHDLVGCKYCKKWMKIKEFEEHYDKCYEIEVLIQHYKKQGKTISRTELEKYPISSLDKALKNFIPNLYGGNNGEL